MISFFFSPWKTKMKRWTKASQHYSAYYLAINSWTVFKRLNIITKKRCKIVHILRMKVKKQRKRHEFFRLTVEQSHCNSWHLRLFSFFFLINLRHNYAFINLSIQLIHLILLSPCLLASNWFSRQTLTFTFGKLMIQLDCFIVDQIMITVYKLWLVELAG